MALSSAVVLGAGMLAVLPLLGTAPAGAVTPTITAVGSITTSDLAVTGTSTTLGDSPTAVGDVLVLAARPSSTGAAVTVSTVTGGGVTTWTEINRHSDATNSQDVELWMGPITAAGSSTITVNFAGGPLSGQNVELGVQEYSSGLGSTTTWSAGPSGNLGNASSASVTYPTLTPASASELYVGYAWVGGTSTSATPTTGYTYFLFPTSTDVFLYNPNVSTAQSPTSTQSAAAVSDSVGAIISANVGPTVTGISPAGGPTAGGTAVTVTGTNFTGATAVHFGATLGTGLTVVSNTQITITSPAGAAGAVDVEVTTPGGTSSPVAADQFTYAALPTVTAVSPSTGPNSGGTSVTITGTNLTGASAVKFGTNAATGITINSATSVTATSPAESVGVVNVTVTTFGGTSATSSADDFTYFLSTGYWMVGSDGGVFAFGSAGFVGSLPGIGVSVNDIVGVVPTSTGKGYWMVGKDGGVFAFGDAGFVGSLPGIGVKVDDIVGVVPTSTGKGYWMVGADGGVFAFGDAGFVGSLPGIGVHVNDIVGVVPTSTGKGYWMVGKDGGVFAFGDAGFVGSLPGIGVSVNNITAVVPTSTGKGYWMVGKDGGVFAFGDAGFVGSLPGINVHVSNIVGAVATSTGKGYWMVGSDGGVFAFGDAGFVGSLPGIGIHVNNIVAVVPT